MTSMCKRVLHYFALLMLLLGSGSAIARSYDDIIESGHMTIAVYNNFPPYSFMENDEPKGVDVEIAKKIAESFGVKLEFMWMNADESVEDDMRHAIWKGHIITRKKADLMMRIPYDRKYSYGIDGYGLPRNELVAMFGPYHRERWTLLNDTNKTNNIETIAIYQYEKVAVETDSLPSFFLGGAIGGRIQKNIIHTTDTFEALDLLATGEVAAIAGMESQVEWGLQTNPNLTDELKAKLQLTSTALAGMTIRAWDIGMAVHTDFRQLAYAVEDVIAPMVQGDEMDKIFKQYGLTFEPSSYYAPEQPLH